MRKKIAILLHERDSYPVLSEHLLWALCENWRARGIEIEVLKGMERRIEADLLIPHLDLTHLPQAYTDYFKHYPRVVNRSLADISKRRISENLLGANDCYDGPVIVKTDLNFGGLPEYRLKGEAVLAGEKMDGHSEPDWARVRYMKAGAYRVFASLKEVPPAVFTNRNLVVERFLPEREGDLYFFRVYQFIGDRGFCTRLGSTEPVVKQRTLASRQDVEIPPDAGAFRKKLGMDFGKLDFTLHGGRLVVFDANRTPGTIKPEEVMRQRVERMASGVEALLEGGRI